MLRGVATLLVVELLVLLLLLELGLVLWLPGVVVVSEDRDEVLLGVLLLELVPLLEL